MAGVQSSLAFFVFSLVAQTLFFGLYTLLVFLSTRALLRRQQRDTTRSVLIFVTLVLYIISTLYWSFSIALVADRVDQAVLASQRSQGSNIGRDDFVVSWSPVVNAAILLNFIISNGILVWRARLICHRALRQYLLVPTGLLGLTIITLLTLVILRFVAFAQSPPGVPTNIVDIIQTLTLAFSVACSLSTAAVVGATASRNRKEFGVAFPGGEFQFSRPDQVLGLVAESGVVYLFFEVLLLISSVVPLREGTLADLYEPVAVQIAGAYPSALLLLIIASESLAHTRLSSLTSEKSSSPTSVDFKPRPLENDGGENGESMPRPTIPRRVTVDLSLDSPRPNMTTFNAIQSSQTRAENSNTTPERTGPGIINTQFTFPTPASTLQPPKRRVMFVVDGDALSSDGSLTPSSNPMSSPGPSGLASNSVADSTDSGSSSDVEEGQLATMPIAQPQPVVARPPFPVLPQTSPQPEPAALPINALKPSRVPIAVGALEYYQKRQQLGMMQTGVNGGLERPASQSTVASVNVGGPAAPFVGGQVVIAQARDHPFPLRSQRSLRQVKEPQTPRTFMAMPENRDQAALDALDLDLELVLGSLDTRSVATRSDVDSINDVQIIEVFQDEEIPFTGVEIPATATEIPVGAENNKSTQSEDDAAQTPIQGTGVGLALYFDLEEEEAESAAATPTQPTLILSEPDVTFPTSPPGLASSAQTMEVDETNLVVESTRTSTLSITTESMMATEAELATAEMLSALKRPISTEQPQPEVEDNVNLESSATEVAEIFENQLEPPHQSQPQRSSIARATMSQFPVRPSRLRAATVTRGPSPNPSMTSTAPSTSSFGDGVPPRGRSQSQSTRINQFPPSGDSSRAPTPTLSVTSSSATTEVTEPINTHQRAKSQRMNQFPVRSQTPSSRAPTPTLLVASSPDNNSTTIAKLLHRRSKSQSSMQRLDENPLAPFRPQSPTTSVTSYGSEVVGPEGALVTPAEPSRAPRKQQLARRQLKRVKSQPRMFGNAPALAISAPLSPEAVELEKERARRKLSFIAIVSHTTNYQMDYPMNLMK
ncbi:hypothetical protein MIND_00097100 [Mycena indigotica]|uniref:Uncharacterized protein n=1 Tax=Mycena indigotica TaxID=2126181 RepID=A0A8H6TE59_9AGAR|nr:uncharacterized protein MIND_00097100 [Mycena indigotica]KAF7315810.1 hypothetical protein MIND_00097100 [Mycena indigotica]